MISIQNHAKWFVLVVEIKILVHEILTTTIGTSVKNC